MVDVLMLVGADTVKVVLDVLSWAKLGQESRIDVLRWHNLPLRTVL